MSTTAPTATTLRDAVVTNEQTRVEWHAGRASIDAGRIVFGATPQAPPAGFFDRRGATFTILAYDGADRVRRFGGVTFAAAESAPPHNFVFR